MIQLWKHQALYIPCIHTRTFVARHPVYIREANWATSVLTRSRALPTHILLAPAALVGAFACFLPDTTSQVGTYAKELEDCHVPRVGEIRRTSIAHSGIGWKRAKEGAAAGRDSVNNSVKIVAERIEEGMELKLKAMGWAQEMKEAQSVVSVAQKDLKEAIESKSSSGNSEDPKSLA
ncbi:hypothetical protein DFH29DRAFT_1084065 [Suillus ampliporus]|nr:hypothetical protein DFH29DRAFT_1084065 [Suillus ampliporus]